jgi:hypothetical protein
MDIILETYNNMYTNKEKNINGNWYEPLNFLKNLKNTIKAELTDTMSSAGDWSGYFIQKKNKKYYVIGFGQENNFPGQGFTLQTSGILARFDYKPSEEEVYQDIIGLW